MAALSRLELGKSASSEVEVVRVGFMGWLKGSAGRDARSAFAVALARMELRLLGACDCVAVSCYCRAPYRHRVLPY